MVHITVITYHKNKLLIRLFTKYLKLGIWGLYPGLEGALPEILDGLGLTQAKEGVWK